MLLRFLCDNLIVWKSVNTVIIPVYAFLSARLFVPNTSSRNVLLFQKLPLFAIAVQKAEPVTRTKHTTSHRMQISPHRNCSYHDRKGINQSAADIVFLLDDLISPLLAQGQSLAHIYAFHGHEIPCSQKDALQLYRPRRFLLLRTSICAARCVTNDKPRKTVVQGHRAWLQKNSV